jgi:hypothetical protein
MNRMRKAALAALGIALVFALGCTKGPGAGQQKPPAAHGQADQRKFDVYIYSDSSPGNSGKCFLDWPVATLWKAYRQTVTWHSDDNQYTIDFTKGSRGSPFQISTYTVPANGSKNSDKLLDTANDYYDFAILDSQGNKCKDPSDPGYYVK